MEEVETKSGIHLQLRRSTIWNQSEGLFEASAIARNRALPLASNHDNTQRSFSTVSARSGRGVSTERGRFLVCFRCRIFESGCDAPIHRHPL